MKMNETTRIYNYLKNNIIINHTEILYFILNNPYGITDKPREDAKSLAVFLFALGYAYQELDALSLQSFQTLLPMLVCLCGAYY